MKTLKEFQDYLKGMDTWLKEFVHLRSYPGGFSFDPKKRPKEFTEKLPEWFPDKIDLEAIHKTYTKGYNDMLTIGVEFASAVCECRPHQKRDLLVLSEAHGHYLHNAAVLAAEAGKLDGSAYEKCLKNLWRLALLSAHSSEHGSKCRGDALMEYARRHTTLGKVILNKTGGQFHKMGVVVHPAYWGLFLFSPLHSNDFGFYDVKSSDKYELAWLREVQEWLAKQVIKKWKNTSAFSSSDLIARLPSNGEERKSWIDQRLKTLEYYAGIRDKAKDPAMLRDKKTTLTQAINKTSVEKLGSVIDKIQQGKYVRGVESELVEHIWYIDSILLGLRPDVRALSRGDRHPIYERLPRRFADSERTAPGVYLHRSKAHGRDDFLVLVSGEGKQRRTAVWCTKGVGADPSMIPDSTAGQYTHAVDFKSKWMAGDRTELPFSCPAPNEEQKAASWRRLGYCVALPGANDEAAVVDYDHFEEMYKHVSKHAKDHKNPLFRHLPKGFVEPYAIVEISSLKANRDRLGPVEKAVNAGDGGYPVEVVTCGPSESSLRIYKRGEVQDYDYDWLELELAEWDRIHGEVPVPLEIAKLLVVDAKRFKDDLGIGETELLLRLRTTYRVLSVILASWVSFLRRGWATDAGTGSFAGRNFGGGPRDSNEWGPIVLNPNAVTKRALVDLADLSQTITSDLPKMMGLFSNNDLDAPDTWPNAALVRITRALESFLGAANKELTGGKLESSKPDEFVKKYVEFIVASAKSFAKKSRYTGYDRSDDYFPEDLINVFASALPKGT